MPLTLRYRQAKENMLKLQILSLKEGSQLMVRAKQRYLRRLEEQEKRADRLEGKVTSISRKLSQMDEDIISLRSLIGERSSSL